MADLPYREKSRDRRRHSAWMLDSSVPRGNASCRNPLVRQCSLTPARSVALTRESAPRRAGTSGHTIASSPLASRPCPPSVSIRSRLQRQHLPVADTYVSSSRGVPPADIVADASTALPAASLSPALLTTPSPSTPSTSTEAPTSGSSTSSTEAVTDADAAHVSNSLSGSSLRSPVGSRTPTSCSYRAVNAACSSLGGATSSRSTCLPFRSDTRRSSPLLAS
mmetsp:Transcript_3908/g.12408  ORF Transcript_3908/g.12408 Transcript_3908/m.12408 type:complete len:222 (-) Transcript_3908:2425-3090(-)